ncbi:restriction endonuclease subunit S [Cytophagaceae bacterium DM2B3-1]|uniref:Restriction endonuclease subunit S n=1 Tax=Xanthocytophaga flava TaxID=3048013 RepID=A0ABT7CYM9_9BACT|nr:restriction endonuclease subunit S [Xanthocytophaga flavus]MDJ1498885.1 restriction endonuclease subunit S [Xanthocytophaga flavus]
MQEELPDNWVYVRLGDICETTSGGTPNRKDPSYFIGNIPWIKSGELNYNIITETEEKISEDALHNSSTKLLPKDTLLIALYGATVGRLAFTGIEAATNQAVCAIFTPEGLSKKYLYYFLLSYKEKLLQQRVGGAQPNINQGIINDIIFPLPPKEEQHRIVAKIEELFSELDHSVALLQKVQKQLKVYRQAVLEWSFEGKLLYKTSTKNKQINITYWQQRRLQDICEKIQDGSHFSPQVQYDEPGAERYMYITSKNIRNNYMDLSTVKYVDKEFHEAIYSRCNPEFGDVLLTKDGSNTGEVTLNTITEPISLLSSVCLFKTNKDELNSAFLKYFFQSPSGIKLIESSMTGTAIKRVILRKLREAMIVLPSIDEQYQIVTEIEQRLSEYDKLGGEISNSLQQAVALRQSILQKSFSGKLVTQNQKDEPAKLLVERIKAEKERLEEVRKQQRKNQPKSTIMAEELQPIVELLKKVNKPMLARDVWQKSIHKDDIQGFYAELKRLMENEKVISEEKTTNGRLSYLSLTT